MALLLGGLMLALSACGPRYYPSPDGPPPPVSPDISRVTPPPPPIGAIRPKT
ncbi:hypothetical protein [Caulobacter sp. Root655]|uniref:hypothetical protein n=1 Tax=Caulobacter sp. Root655 TaxID=1736578 RepID=UPI000AD9646B|nr:hypothetical protein [Caulobacter sp. Root655]